MYGLIRGQGPIATYRNFAPHPRNVGTRLMTAWPDSDRGKFEGEEKVFGELVSRQSRCDGSD